MFSERLKELRNDKGLSQEDLAKILNVKQQTVGGWEVGRTEPDHETLCRIANFFNVSIDYLLGRTRYVTPKEFFPATIAEEMEKYAEWIEIFKEKKYTPEEIAEVADFIRKHSK